MYQLHLAVPAHFAVETYPLAAIIVGCNCYIFQLYHCINFEMGIFRLWHSCIQRAIWTPTKVVWRNR